MDIEEIGKVSSTLFKCLRKENNGIREETNDLMSDWKADISTLEKKFDSLNIDIDNINQYEHGDWLVISGDIIPHGKPTENSDSS